MGRNNLRVVGESDSRSETRTKSLRSGKVVFGANQFSRDCTIRDVSEGGFRVKVEDPSTVPNEFTLLDIRKFVAFKAHVKWRRGDELGLSVEEECPLDNTQTLRIKTLRELAVEAKQRLGG